MKLIEIRFSGGNHLHLINTGDKSSSDLCSIGRSGAMVYSSDDSKRYSSDLCSIASACIEGGGKLIYYDFGHLYANDLRSIRLRGGQIEIRCVRYPSDISSILG